MELEDTEIPATVRNILEPLVQSMHETLGPDLISVVLFGSAAEGRMRTTSDVNVVFVLAKFLPDRVSLFADQLRVADAAINLSPMFLLESEVQTAAEMFAVKFADISRRHKVLFGKDVFSQLSIPRAAIISRVRQVLLNQILRLRAGFAENIEFVERMQFLIADSAGPLRASAAALFELQGKRVASAREALRDFVAGLARPELAEALSLMSAVREGTKLDQAQAKRTLIAITDIALLMKEQVKLLT